MDITNNIIIIIIIINSIINIPWDLIGPRRERSNLPSGREGAADERQRDGDDEPEKQHREEKSQRDGS